MKKLTINTKEYEFSDGSYQLFKNFMSTVTKNYEDIKTQIGFLIEMEYPGDNVISVTKLEPIINIVKESRGIEFPKKKKRKKMNVNSYFLDVLNENVFFSYIFWEVLYAICVIFSAIFFFTSGFGESSFMWLWGFGIFTTLVGIRGHIVQKINRYKIKEKTMSFTNPLFLVANFIILLFMIVFFTLSFLIHNNII